MTDTSPSVRRRGLMLVLSSPSGAGKTTIARELLATESQLEMSVSATTRQPRPGEIAGKDYHFVDIAAFERMVSEGEMLEHAKVFDNYYGTRPSRCAKPWPRARMCCSTSIGRAHSN